MAKGALNLSAWEKAGEQLDEIKRRNSVFIRLEDNGDSTVVAFVGDPRIRETHWTGAEYKDCEGDGCELCGKGLRVSAKVMLNAFERDSGLMRVFECGGTTFKTVLKVVKKYGLVWWFEIERQGSKNDPKTTYTVLPEAALDDADQKAIAGAKRHDLYSLGSEDFPKDEPNGHDEPQAPAKANESPKPASPKAAAPPKAKPSGVPKTERADSPKAAPHVAPGATTANPDDDFDMFE